MRVLSYPGVGEGVDIEIEVIVPDRGTLKFGQVLSNIRKGGDCSFTYANRMKLK
jgi:hypothetical protein